MRTYLVEACENIDSALFSDDEFQSAANRAELGEYIARWYLKLHKLAMDDIQGLECTDLNLAKNKLESVRVILDRALIDRWDPGIGSTLTKWVFTITSDDR